MADLDPDWILDGRDVDVRLGAALTATDYTLAVDSTVAVTLTVHDQKRVLISSGVLDANADGKLDAGVEIKLDGALYRLAAVKKTGDTFSLPFEDRLAARLRDARGQLKPRAGEGHVRFAKRLVQLVGGEFVTPTGVAVATDGTVTQHKAARAAADDRREKGFADAILGTTTSDSPNFAGVTGAGSAGVGTVGGLTIKGAAIQKGQVRNLEIAMGVAAKEQAGQRVTIAMLCAGIGESAFRSVVNSTGYGGVFQGDVSHRYRYFKVGDTAAMATSFLRGGKGFQQGGAIALAAANPSFSAGEIATRVEASGQPASFYDRWVSEAHRLYAHYNGIDSIPASGVLLGSDGTESVSGVDVTLPNGLVLKGVTVGPVLVQRGTPDDPNEDSWTCLQRISAGKGYRCFALRNRVYYGREQDFIRSRARMSISEQSPGIDWIDWEWSPRKKVNTATVTCRASLWAAPPGSSVILRDCGKADGRWLVSSFKRSRDTKDATIELRRGTELLQPPKTKESTGPVSQAGSGSLKAVCKTISDQGRKYLYGGGHGKPLDDITGKEPLDCSSSCSLALKEAGLFTGTVAWVSGKFASSFGEAGRGKTWTIWASSEHVFIQSSTPDDKWRFDTGGPGGGDGPRLRSMWRDTSGFSPRRAKGDR